jgi:predicted dehydrogenase
MKDDGKLESTALEGNHHELRVGWIGSGFVGQLAHLHNYIGLPEIKITDLAELRPNLGKMVCDRFDIQNVYPSHKELLLEKRSELDAVVAIVRREHTASVAMDVLSAGLPLFTEKPMAPTVDQGQKLVSLAKTAGVTYATGFMRRHDDGVKLAKTIFDDMRVSKEMGDPLFFRCYCFGGGDYCNISGDIKTTEPAPRDRILPIAPDWVPVRLEREYERFLNVFVHDINLIRFFTEEDPVIDRVQYRPDSGSVGLNFGEFPGVFEFAHLDTDQFWEEGVEIIFSRGRIKVALAPAFLRNQPACVEITKESASGGIESMHPRTGWTWAFKNQASAFLENVARGTTPIASGEDSLRDLIVVENIWKKII